MQSTEKINNKFIKLIIHFFPSIFHMTPGLHTKQIIKQLLHCIKFHITAYVVKKCLTYDFRHTVQICSIPWTQHFISKGSIVCLLASFYVSKIEIFKIFSENIKLVCLCLFNFHGSILLWGGGGGVKNLSSVTNSRPDIKGLADT